MTADFKTLALVDGGTLAFGTVAGTAKTPVLVIPRSWSAKVATAMIHNASGSTLTSVAIYKTVAGVEARVCLISNLAAGDSTSVFELIESYLDAGVVISIVASAAAAVTYDFTGPVSS